MGWDGGVLEFRPILSPKGGRKECVTRCLPSLDTLATDFPCSPSSHLLPTLIATATTTSYSDCTVDRWFARESAR